MQLCLTLDTQQLEALAAALEAVDTALGRQSASEGLGLGDAAGGAGRSGARSSRGSSMWLAEQRRDLAAHVSGVCAATLPGGSETACSVWNCCNVLTVPMPRRLFFVLSVRY
jgi:hypothetical protein